MAEPRELRGLKVVAHAAQVSEKTAARWIRSGRLPASKPGGRTSAVRVDRADLEKLLRGK